LIAEKNRDEEDCAGPAATSSDFSFSAAAATSDRLFRLKIIAQVQLQIEQVQLQIEQVQQT
jgi:hypothetical protein